MGLKDDTDSARQALCEEFAKLVWRELHKVLPAESREETAPKINIDIKYDCKIHHLLGLVHDIWVQGMQLIEDDQDRKSGNRAVKVIGWTTELKEAGITFEKVDENHENSVVSLFQVEFKDGKMKIPTLVIGGMTSRLFYNLIAYEVRLGTSTCVTDYARLMFNLVNTADDVKLLRSTGIIKNTLADDEAVAQMLKKLLDNVQLGDQSFIYNEIFIDVQQHCAKRWYTMIAKLRHDYFSTPWSGIAFVAALLVFLVTIATFIFSFLKKN